MQDNYYGIYELMWQMLEERVKSRSRWGRLELIAVMREIEVGIWRKVEYLFMEAHNNLLALAKVGVSNES